MQYFTGIQDAQGTEQPLQIYCSLKLVFSLREKRYAVSARDKDTETGNMPSRACCQSTYNQDQLIAGKSETHVGERGLLAIHYY